MSLIRKHTVSILLRLDEAQHRHLQKQVAASGLSTTQFLRDLIEGVEVKARLPNELPELLRQTQELEWAYGEEAQSKLDAMTGQVLQTLEETKPEQREQELEFLLERGRWQGVIDRDAILQHLEEHLAELSRLLERSEDAVLLELEQERERVGYISNRDLE